jgi:hypothetical protein
MELRVTEHFEENVVATFDGTSPVQVGTQWAEDRMEEAVASAFSDIEHNSIGYRVPADDEDEVVVQASMEWVDERYLFENTDSWRDTVHGEAAESVDIEGLSPRQSGVKAKGKVTVRLAPDRFSVKEAFESEARDVASSRLKTSFGTLSQLDYAGVLETDFDAYRRAFEVHYVVEIPYRESLLGLETQRQAFRQLAVPGDWETVAKMY